MPLGLSCSLDHIKSIAGVLQMFELLFDLLALIIGAAPPDVPGFSGNKGFFIFVTVLALVITLIFFILFCMKAQKLCCTARWFWIQIIWCAFISLLFFIGSIVIAVVGKENGAYGAAAFFGFAAMITYIADIIYTWRNRDASNPADLYGPSRSGDMPGPPNYA